ncbi:deoxyribose-phosphate aldolase [Paenibacillus radicis (ex Xue et al. 2023)]|uniref:Deoxyribose-phosphate aldolase n=1 Tax=Paenibacillus radicis (ex Xue et al. 2023) TaxID=2972489 RepID=A0ABT1YHK8_9BACL|nr:deoxyribose-phosphate aldolase [Paenibacillus radicis (ex Xue et al. 2023)]MCR8631440.1 deoxyribose-phosphate aldolase [Paenibacillus radicis (ex Xue et al. 2023)]
MSEAQKGLSIDPKQIPAYIDHTLLKADSNEQAVLKLCDEAVKYGFYSVCVNGVWVPVCKKALTGSEVKISVVCGFPLGANDSAVKAFEAAKAAEAGADEIDMVLQVGQLMEGNYDAVREDIRAVVQAVQGQAIVKVIFETGFLNEEQKIAACRLSEEAGAHYVKTSTGFGPGGATVEDIRLMRGNVSASIGVKASGGVRDLETALKMIEAGATRLGTSSGVAIVNGLKDNSSY